MNWRQGVRTHLAAGVTAIALLAGAALGARPVAAQDPVALAAQIEDELMRKLDVWYPRVMDTQYGGYLTDFTHDWRQTENQNRMIVTQSRHLWTLSKVGEAFPERPQYADFARSGFEFLRDHMWDREFGGFHQNVTRDGRPIPDNNGELSKTLYGNAFAIYGLAAYYGFSRDPEVLDLARQAFDWLERNSHDKQYGGYFQPLARDGTPTTTGHPKDYNSGIHILESLAELYSVWPDPLVRERLTEMFHIVRDTMVADEGYLKLYFTRDWDHLTYRDSTEEVIRRNSGRDHITPGHDIETAFLLLEAAHILGMDDDPTTHRIARRLTDHALESGWDHDTGGLFDSGYYFRGDDEVTILRRTKSWWAQAEALHTLAIMSRLYPDDPLYTTRLHEQWEHIKKYLVDQQHGGWYPNSLDTNPQSVTGNKSQIWKGNYHTVRSLMGALHQLRH